MGPRLKLIGNAKEVGGKVGRLIGPIRCPLALAMAAKVNGDGAIACCRQLFERLGPSAFGLASAVREQHRCACVGTGNVTDDLNAVRSRKYDSLMGHA
jgi:hypothetical protein